MTKKFPLIVLFITSCLYCSVIETTKQDSLHYKNERRLYHIEGIRVLSDSDKVSRGNIESVFFDDIESAQYSNIAEVMDRLSGLSISTSGKGESNLQVRGFNRRQIAVFIDGSPLTGGYFGNVDFETIPFSDIKEIQILKGPVAALYGHNVMGGAINIVTREIDNDKILHAGFTLKDTGSINSFFSSSQDFGVYNYWIYLSRHFRRFYRLSQDYQPNQVQSSFRRKNSDRSSYDLQSRFGLIINDIHSVNFSGNYTKYFYKGIPPDIYDAYAFRRYTNWERIRSSVISTWELSYNLFFDLGVHYDFFNNTYVEYHDDTYTDIRLESIIKNYSLGWDLKNRWLYDNNLSFDFGYRGEYQFIERKDNMGYPDWINRAYTIQSGFTQIDYKLLNGFNTAGSINFLHFYKNEFNTSHNYIEPALGFFYQREQLELGLSFSRNINLPTMRQLYSRTSGNPKLKPEKARKYELTFKNIYFTNFSPVTFKSSLYYNEIFDQISRVFNPENHSRLFENIDKSYYFGIDSGLIFQLNGKLIQSVDYSFIDYLRRSNLPLRNYPKHRLSLGTDLVYEDIIRANILSVWTGRRKSVDNYDRVEYLPSYWTHNITFSRDFRILSVSLKVNNLFDAYFEEDFGLPAEGRSFMISMGFKY